MVMFGNSAWLKAKALPVKCTMSEGLCSACEERATICQQIERLEEEIAKLKEKHHLLGSPMNAIHEPFIHKFPPEIASHILRLSLPKLEYGGSSPLVIRRGLAETLRLGAVCRKWRQLAWATPNLWETIYIAIRPDTELPLAKLMPGLVREWLDRSGVVPLTIVFNHERASSYDSASEDDFFDDDPIYHQEDTIDELHDLTGSVIELLNSQSGRWQNLYLNAGADMFAWFSGSSQPEQLVGLELAVKTSVPSHSLTPEFEMESDPHPIHLKLTNFPLTSINIGWENITHVTLDTVSTEEAVDLLRRAPNLEHYRVSIADISGPTEIVSPILHPRLQSLDLSAKRSVKKFLKAITLPSLEEWTQDMGGAPLRTLTFLSLLKRSNCRLKVLKLDHLPPPSVDLLHILQATPTLEHLQLYFHDKFSDVAVMDDILARIFCSVASSSNAAAGNVSAENATRRSLLPRLQSFDCTAPYVAAFTWDHIPQLYRQSHRRSIILKSAASIRSIRDETALQLLQLVDEGVDLQISDFSGGDFLKNFKNRTHKQGVYMPEVAASTPRLRKVAVPGRKS